MPDGTSLASLGSEAVVAEAGKRLAHQSESCRSDMADATPPERLMMQGVPDGKWPVIREEEERKSVVGEDGEMPNWAMRSGARSRG